MAYVSAPANGSESPPGEGVLEQIVLTARGYAELVGKLQRLTTVKRPEVAERLRATVEVAGDMSEDPDLRDARAELDLLDQRIALLEQRLHAARVLAPTESSGGVASLGSHITLDDLDDNTRTEYLLASTAEADPLHGRLSDDSPVGKAIIGHKRGDTIDVSVPHGTRHLRIAHVGADNEAG